MQLSDFFTSILAPVRNAFDGGYRPASNQDLRTMLAATEQTIAHFEDRVSWLENAVGKAEAEAEAVVNVVEPAVNPEPVAPTQTAGDVSSTEAPAPVVEAAAAPAVDAAAAAPSFPEPAPDAPSNG